jgi:hypothetical protein
MNYGKGPPGPKNVEPAGRRPGGTNRRRSRQGAIADNPSSPRFGQVSDQNALPPAAWTSLRKTLQEAQP